MPKALDELRSRIDDPQVVLVDDASRFAASFDNLRISFLPEAVLRPRDEEDVALILRLANEHKVPVTPRGGGTAATGAAAPINGGWVLDLSHWQNLQIDAAAGMAFVQPGVRTADLAAAAEAEGWYYPPDPSSHKFCTLGGNIACNAGGMRGAKYGVTRDYVISLEGFLPTGEWVRWGANLRKFSAGFNLRDLWIGSEGMLGVITGAVMRLVPKPQARTALLFAFEDDVKALRAVKATLRRRIVPSVMEFMDCQTVACTLREGLKLPLKGVNNPEAAPAVLLVELDGARDRVDADAAALVKLMEGRALVHRRARSQAEAETLWQVRRRCSKAMFQLADSKLNEDVVVPLESQEALLKFSRQLAEESGLATPTFGHAADGNFHVHVMYNRGDPEQRSKAEGAGQRIMETVIERGGASSGEHGIGLAKTPFLGLQHSQAEIAAMRAIKQALDPNGILNPGKMFEPFEVWKHPTVKVKTAWDA